MDGGLKTRGETLKAKFVKQYEDLFNGIVDISNKRFWHELFLLRVNKQWLIGELSSWRAEDAVVMKTLLQTLFREAVSSVDRHSPAASANSLQTTAIILQQLSLKLHEDTFSLCFGEDGEHLLAQLLASICDLCTGVPPARRPCVSYILTLVTLWERPNPAVDTIVRCLELFDLLCAVLHWQHQLSLNTTEPTNQEDSEVSYDVVCLLGLLTHYRSRGDPDSNFWAKKLSIVDNEVVLGAFTSVVSQGLVASNHCYAAAQARPRGVLSSVSNLVGGWLSGQSAVVETTSNNMLLLALYMGMSLNRNVITTFSHARVDSEDMNQQHSNLFVTFLEYTSILAQNVKDNEGNLQLCLVILLCICEDQGANHVMHDENLIFKVNVQHLPMRHRKVTSYSGVSRQLACAVIEICQEFISSHMMKHFSFASHDYCLGVVRRILCYSKHYRHKLTYPWQDLWLALITLLRYLTTNAPVLLRRGNIFVLIGHIAVLFNLFITFGDMFLTQPKNYDQLYYEIVREHDTFEAASKLCENYPSNGEMEGEARQAFNLLSNIRSIVAHFNSKLDEYMIEKGLNQVSAEDVMTVINCNYGSLTLKLLQNVDNFERFKETPAVSAIVESMVADVLLEKRHHLGPLDVDALLRWQEASPAEEDTELTSPPLSPRLHSESEAISLV